MNKGLRGFLTFVLGLIMFVGGLFPSFISGQEKAKPHVVIPEAADVSEIKFNAEKFFPGGPFELTLTKPEEVKPLITLLRGVGWDYSKSGDARVIKSQSGLQSRSPKKAKQIFISSSQI